MARSGLIRWVALVALASMLWGATAAARAPSPSAREPVSLHGADARAASPSGSLQPQARTTPRGRATASSQPRRARARALASTEVFGFLPSWELGDAAAIDLERLTTLAWFSLEAHPDGRLIRTTDGGTPSPGWVGWTSQAFTDLLARAHQADVRVVLTVERFAWDAAGRRSTIALLTDPRARRALVKDIVATITERGADGVSLDFEPLPTVARKPFTALVRELRAAMNAVDRGLQLTVVLTPDLSGYAVGPLTAADAADAAILMGYEYRTAASRAAGSIDPLSDPDGPDLRGSVRAILRRIPPARVILALPWYGRAWSTTGPKPGAKTRAGDAILGPSTAGYADAIARATRTGRLFDRASGSAWSRYRASPCGTCAVSWRQLWYDDVDSVRAKVGFALGKGLRGVGIWALGLQGDRPELWSALRLAVTGARDRTPPTGSASLAAGSIIGERDGLPLVGDVLTIDLVAGDGARGSGVAFVRISTTGRRGPDGQLIRGVTFPAADAVDIAMPDAAPVDEVFVPGGAASSATTTPAPSPRSRPRSDGQATATSSPRTIRVQWRDVAGNWSRPVVLRVFHQAGASPPAQVRTPGP